MWQDVIYFVNGKYLIFYNKIIRNSWIKEIEECVKIILQLKEIY